MVHSNAITDSSENVAKKALIPKSFVGDPTNDGVLATEESRE